MRSFVESSVFCSMRWVGLFRCAIWPSLSEVRPAAFASAAALASAIALASALALASAAAAQAVYPPAAHALYPGVVCRESSGRGGGGGQEKVREKR